MGKKKLAVEVAEAVEAIERAKEEIEDVEEAVKAKAEGKPEKKSKAKKPNDLAVKVLSAMQALKANGIVEVTSTVMRDKLSLDKETGRDQVRRVMRSLAKEGKVIIGEKKHGKRKQYVYKLP